MAATPVVLPNLSAAESAGRRLAAAAAAAVAQTLDQSAGSAETVVAAVAWPAAAAFSAWLA